MDCALKSVCFHKNKATNFFIIDAMQENQSLISRYLDKQCPACGDTIAKMVFDAGVQPLATIAWAETGVEAKAVQSFKQEYVQCLNCSHRNNCGSGERVRQILETTQRFDLAWRMCTENN